MLEMMPTLCQPLISCKIHYYISDAPEVPDDDIYVTKQLSKEH